MKICGNVYRNFYRTIKSPKRLTWVFIRGSPKTGSGWAGDKKGGRKTPKTKPCTDETQNNQKECLLKLVSWFTLITELNASPGQQHKLDWYIIFLSSLFVVVLLSRAIIYVPSLPSLIRMPGSDRGVGRRTPLPCKPLTDIESPFCCCTRDSLCFRRSDGEIKANPQY